MNPTEVYGPEDTGFITAETLIDFARSAPAVVCDGGTSVAHVDDVARSIVAALDRGRPGERYILGGENLTIEQIARETLDILGRPPRILKVPNVSSAWWLGWARRCGCPFPSTPRRSLTRRHWYMSNAKAVRELDASFRSARASLDGHCGLAVPSGAHQMSSAMALLVGISVLLLILFGAGLIWLAFRLRPYVLAARKWAVVLYGAFVDSADTPMDGAHYDVYRRLKHLGVWAVEEGIVSRFLLVETAPGVKSVIYDVSSRGQFGFLLSQMRRHPCIADDERIVIDLGANDGFQGSHSYNLTQLGWWAVLVEANPHLEAELRHNAARKKRWFGHADRDRPHERCHPARGRRPHLGRRGMGTHRVIAAALDQGGSFGVTARGESVRTLMGAPSSSR